MITIFIVLQLIIAISLVVVILLQHGKGADIGSAFGGGNNNAMFAPADATNILTKITWGLVVAFFSITIAISAVQKTSLESDLERIEKFFHLKLVLAHLSIYIFYHQEKKIG